MTVLPVFTLASVSASMALIFFYAPTESLQGEVQRIFYIHVPSAWVAYLSFGLVALASFFVLARRASWERWDRVGAAAAEVGVLFTTIVLVTGPVWGRRVWGVWWVWDARLTSTLVLWLVYAGYLVFRWQTPPGPRRARLSAVIGIVGVADIPIIRFSVEWWTTQHPGRTVLAGERLPASMGVTLAVSLVAITALFVMLLRLRVGIESARARLEGAARA